MSIDVPAQPRTTARYQEKRDTILNAAARLFNEQGVRGATLADIAASVGLVTTSITYYYRKKEDLATACFLRAIEAHRAVAREAAQGDGVAERVTRFVALQVEMMARIDSGRQPPLILFNDIRTLPEVHADQVFSAYTSMFRGVRQLLQEQPRADAPQAVSREALNARSHLLLAAVQWVRAWISRYELDEYPRMARWVADLLLHGMSAAGSAWPGAAERGAIDLADPPGGPEDTADAFLRAATTLVNDQGYRGASVDKISAHLNVTKGAFYHYNETKLDLITACFERNFAVLRRTLRAAEDARGPGWLRACAAVDKLVQFQLSDRGPLLRVSATSALPDPAQAEAVRRTMHRLTERLASVLVDGMVDGSVRPLDAAVGAQMLASAINAAAELRRWSPGIGAQTVTDAYTRPALLGLLHAG